MSGYQGNVVFDGPRWLAQHDYVIATISQSEELFDYFPAINAAFAFKKSDQISRFFKLGIWQGHGYWVWKGKGETNHAWVYRGSGGGVLT